jgi:hypothetical protein
LDGRSSVIVLTTEIIGPTTDDAKLVFERYGDRYFFAQAQWAGDATGLAAMRPKEHSDKHIAKTSKKTVIVIAAE